MPAVIASGILDKDKLAKLIKPYGAVIKEGEMPNNMYVQCDTLEIAKKVSAIVISLK